MNTRVNPFSYAAIFFVTILCLILLSETAEAKRFYRGHPWCERPIISGAARGPGYKYNKDTHRVSPNFSRSREALQLLLHQTEIEGVNISSEKKPIYYQLQAAFQYHVGDFEKSKQAPVISVTTQKSRAENAAYNWASKKENKPFPGEVLIIEVPSQYVCDRSRWKAAITASGKRVYDPDHPIFSTCKVFKINNPNEEEWVFVHEIPGSYIVGSYPHPDSDEIKTCSDRPDETKKPSDDGGKRTKLRGKKSSGGKKGAKSSGKKGRQLKLGGVNVDLNTLFNTVLEYLKGQFQEALQAQRDNIVGEIKGEAEDYAQEMYQDFLYWLNDKVYQEIGSQYSIDSKAFEDEFLAWINAPGQNLKKYISDYLKEKSGTLGWLIEAYQDEASWEIIGGMKDIWEDAKEKYDRFTRLYEEAEADPDTPYGDLLKKHGFSGPWIDNFKEYEGRFNAFDSKFKVVEAGNIVVGAFQSKVPRDKINSMFQLIELMGGVAEDSKIPIVSLFGQIVKAYGEIATKMLEQIDGLAKKLRERQGFCVGVGTTQDERNDAFKKDFGEGLLICPVMMSPDIYERVLPEDNRLYFWVKDKFVEGQDKGGGIPAVKQIMQLAQDAASLGYDGLSSYRGKESDIEWIAKVYNTPYSHKKHGSGVPGLLKESEEVVKGIAERVTALESGFTGTEEICNVDDLHTYFSNNLGLRTAFVSTADKEWGPAIAAISDTLIILMATSYIDKRKGAYDTYTAVWKKLQSLSLLRLKGKVKDKNNPDKKCERCVEATINLSTENSSQLSGCEIVKADEQGEFVAYILTETTGFVVKVSAAVDDKSSETLRVNSQVIGAGTIPFVQRFSLSIFIDLEKEGLKASDEIDINFSVNDSKSGAKISDAKVTFDGETKEAVDGIVKFKRAYEIFDYQESGSKQYEIKAFASGYDEKTNYYTSEQLVEILDREVRSVEITILLDPETKSENIDRFEVECDKNEIDENDSSFCNAYIYYKTEEKKNVSVETSWKPEYVEEQKGTVKGQKVQETNPLPYTVKVEAAYEVTGDDEPQSFSAEAEVLVKKESAESVSGISLSKTPSSDKIDQGDTVTYSYGITNTGDSKLTEIDIVDDKCGSISYSGGDANNDDILDPDEIWTYECSATPDADITNTATATGKDSDGVAVSDTATASVEVVSSPDGCPPPQVAVPYVLYMTKAEAEQEFEKVSLQLQVTGEIFSDFFTEGQVMEQTPYDGECVDPNTMIGLVVSLGPEPDKEPEKPTGQLRAELDCGSGFELAPGDFMGRSCGIVVRGWRSNTEDRVEVEVDYNQESGIEIFPGSTSAPPSLMYTAGVTDIYDSYIFSQSFKAKDDASPGATTITITVRQAGAGQVTLSLTVEVLRKGLLPSSGPGIRPPANVETGSGGDYCVWRYKLFGDPPPCFHFVNAACDTPRYNNPNNGYELVGMSMTWGEAGKRMDQLSRYFKNEYGCGGVFAANTKDTDGDGVIDKEDKCPIDNPDDTDGDGVCDSADRCPKDNPDDTDGDGVCDSDDWCPKDKLDDRDRDGKCDSDDDCPDDYFNDRDGDGDCDSKDKCPYDNPDDTDGDGVCDTDDPCPKDNPDDANGNGYCDSDELCESDLDGDGVCDPDDPCPKDNPDDANGNGLCDSDEPCKSDRDGDGVCDPDDPCPDSNPDDANGNGICDSTEGCVSDIDGDGVCDPDDPCPRDNPDDSDGDGVCNSDDVCPGENDTIDKNRDGIPDCESPFEGGDDEELTNIWGGRSQTRPGQQQGGAGTQTPGGGGRFGQETLEGVITSTQVPTTTLPPKPPPKVSVTPPPTTTTTTLPASTGGTKPPPANVKGIETTEVPGVTVTPGKCLIVQGQLVPVKNYKENISGMTVVLKGPEGRTTTSSGSGAFSFPEIPAGDYEISVKEWNYGMTKADLKAPSGKAIKIVLKGSCPYLYVWTGDQFEKENDIYSTARLLPQEIISGLGSQVDINSDLAVFGIPLDSIPEKFYKKKAYHDYYQIINTPKINADNVLRLKIAERAGEHSFTDHISLLAVERMENFQVGITRQGRLFYYYDLTEIPLESRVKNSADSGTAEEFYDKDIFEFDIPPEAFDNGILAVQWQGFLTGNAQGRSSTPGKPHLALQRKDIKGVWKTVDYIYPRDRAEVAFLELDNNETTWGPESTVRLKAANCLAEKFHRVSSLAWGSGAEVEPDRIEIKLISAKKEESADDVTSLLEKDDSNFMTLSPNEEVVLDFEADVINKDKDYFFFFMADGFYIPGTVIQIAGGE